MMNKARSKTTQTNKTTKTTKTAKTTMPQPPQSVNTKETMPRKIAFDPAIFEMLNPNAAGIDVATEEMWVCVPANRDAQNVRKFGAFTEDLYAIADWLSVCGITSVAMESTGVYWIPLYQVLEARGFDVCLTNARHLKNVSGRPKTDRLDCQWIQRLHSYGFLKASFRPTDAVCQIRSIQRHREALIQEASRHVQHMQKAFHQMNVLLPKVVKDITGVTGMAIIQKILDGERNPVKLATLRNPHCKSSEDEIAKALKGDYRREHLFVLRQAYNAYHFVHTQLRECDREIERLLHALDKQVDATQTPPPPRTKPSPPKRKNAHVFTGDARIILYECFGTDITEITGIDTTNGLVLFTEVGTDLSAWDSEKQFTSWLGLSPNPHASGGKMKSSNTRKVSNPATWAFRMAAKSAAKSQTYLGAFYRRMKARLGAPKAMTATARKIAIIFYRMVKDHTPYHDLGEDYYMKQNRERAVKRLKQQAKRLGLTVVAQQA
jgi:transposase